MYESKKVKVIPKSKEDLEQFLEDVLAEAYEENSYVLDFIKNTEDYVVIYLKEKEV